MRSHITLMPTAEHAAVGRMNGDIPVIALDEAYGVISLQFNPTTPDATIAYLTTLVAEASKLLEAVKAQAKS
jgi:hypothetical protein